MNPRFSICIPVWEQHGFGLEYLKELIHSIRKQTFRDYEIVISDHSKNEYIYEYQKNLDLNIRYIKNWTNYGNGVSNLNAALTKAKGELIKIMFQDDLMFSDQCLQKINDRFENVNTNWLVCGCNHTRDGVNFERPMIPSWNDQIQYGNNTISSPSVLTFRNKNINLFDENLVMLMDVEYYYQLYLRYGLPEILPECLISNRQHPNQISSRYNLDLNQEIAKVRQKYDSN